MTYSYIKPYMDGSVALHYSMIVCCSQCGKRLGGDKDVLGVNFCPSCGHKLHRIPMNVSPEKIVKALNEAEAAKQ